MFTIDQGNKNFQQNCMSRSTRRRGNVQRNHKKRNTIANVLPMNHSHEGRIPPAAKPSPPPKNKATAMAEALGWRRRPTPEDSMRPQRYLRSARHARPASPIAERYCAAYFPPSWFCLLRWCAALRIGQEADTGQAHSRRRRHCCRPGCRWRSRFRRGSWGPGLPPGRGHGCRGRGAPGIGEQVAAQREARRVPVPGLRLTPPRCSRWRCPPSAGGRRCRRHWSRRRPSRASRSRCS